jgi:hypothetical protein
LLKVSPSMDHLLSSTRITLVGFPFIASLRALAPRRATKVSSYCQDCASYRLLPTIVMWIDSVVRGASSRRLP